MTNKRVIVWLREDILNDPSYNEMVEKYQEIAKDIVSGRASGVVLPLEEYGDLPIVEVSVFDKEDLLALYLPVDWLSEDFLPTEEQQVVLEKMKSFLRKQEDCIMLPISNTLYGGKYTHNLIKKLN